MAQRFSDLWTELQGMGLVFSAHGSDEFNTWGRRLAMHSATDLKRGLDACSHHTRDRGKLDLPTFLDYCKPPKAAHLPALTDGKSLGDARFQVLHKVTMAMSKEPGDGPITRATKEGRLTEGFIRGKSADEVIAACKELYT